MEDTRQFRQREKRLNSCIVLRVHLLLYKHGSTNLVLPKKPFKTDLTICVDISSNPGPEPATVAPNRQCLQRSPPHYNTVARTAYSSSLLHSLRRSQLSKHIEHTLHTYLASFGILKPYRGRRGGSKVKIRNDIYNNNRHEFSFFMHHYACRPSNCILIPIDQTLTNAPTTRTTPSKEFVPSLMLTNVMSLAPKIDEVRHFVVNSNPELVFITETWLTNAIDTNHIHIPEYNIACKNRTTGNHGGVCLYIKNTIQFEILHNFHSEQIEVLWVKTRPPRLPRGIPCIITGTLYHPPSANDDIILEYLAKSLTDLEGHYPECGIILAGDFNRLQVSRLSHQFRMKQLVNLHTRGNHTLDLILTNLHRFYDKKSLSLFPPFGLSDHNVLLLSPKDRPTSAPKKKVIWKRDMRETRIQELGRYLSVFDWDILNHATSCEGKQQLFEDLINTGLDIIMPLKKSLLHSNNPPWITPEFINLIKRRQQAFAKKNMAVYRYYRNLVNRERKRLRSHYFSSKVSQLKNTKPSAWWHELKKISGMQPGTDPGSVYSQLKFDHVADEANLEEIANQINEAFLKPMQNYQPLSYNPFINNDQFSPDLETFELTEYSTYNLLRKLNPRKACGPDGISNWLFKTFAEILAKPVCIILNTSFDEQKLPPIWKHADITPIPKLKPVTDVNKHLRPISLTPAISKIAEEFVIEKYVAPAVLKIIDSNQYGAIPKSSSVDALISMVHQWSQATDKSGDAVRVSLFDYKKAFDLIDHNILIRKLQSLSIPRKVNSWIADFLSNRYQRVKLADAHSSWKHTPSGVPQGTKLGPWLFLLMVNDLAMNETSTWKFVDDTTISEAVSKNHCSLIQSAVTSVENWSVENKMQLNPEKCKELRIDFKRNKQDFHPININNVTLEAVDHAKILGLIISNSLQWNHHVNHIIKKANKRLYCLVQLKRAKISKKDIVNFYCTCIRPTLEYASQVFHHSLPKYLSDDIERVQKRSLAIIFRGQPYSESLQQSGLSSLFKRREELCKNLFSKITSDSNHKLRTLLPPKHHAKYNLRHKRTYELPIAFTNRFKYTFIPSMSRRINQVSIL